jgi:hypothetical protein
MRSYQVFSRMTPEQAATMMAALEEKVPAVYTQAVATASAAMKVRPKFLMRQSREKRADMVRRTLATVRANPLAEEVLASFFLEVRKDLLTEWLDLLGLEHEEGLLKAENPPSPPKETLEKAVQRLTTARSGSSCCGPLPRRAPSTGRISRPAWRRPERATMSPARARSDSDRDFVWTREGHSPKRTALAVRSARP